MGFYCVPNGKSNLEFKYDPSSQGLTVIVYTLKEKFVFCPNLHKSYNFGICSSFFFRIPNFSYQWNFLDS